MPHSFGYRARTRDLFAKDFRQKGRMPLARLAQPLRIGDYVDIKGDGAIHGGMPHKYYHGKTGVIWNVTRRAVGVEIQKPVGNRYIRKRIHVRHEHVHKSDCRKEFLSRLKTNEETKKICKEKNERYNLKRTPQLPRKGYILRTSKREVNILAPLPFTGIPV